MSVPLAILLGVLVSASLACGGGDDSDDATGVTPTRSDRRTTFGTTGTPAATAAPTDVIAGPTQRPTRMPTPDPGPAPGEDPQGDQLLYLALGDSLSEGIGASKEKRTAWVPLVSIGLGGEYELLNLGVAGDDSEELIEDGPLDRALAEISQRKGDGVPDNEVAAISLEIGGNDLLDIYFDLVIPGDCPTVIESFQRPDCVQRLEDALARYQPNLRYTLDILQTAAPGVPIYLMTLYNPFSGGSTILDEFGILALEGLDGTVFPEGVNDIIRAEAAAHPGVVLVDWYPLFLNKQQEYISLDFIHPNDTGHRVMADAVLTAMAQSGLP